MRVLGLFLILCSFSGSIGCGGKASEGSNRDKDKPRPDPKGARTNLFRENTQRHKGALLEDNSQETHPLAWVGCLQQS